jgi:sulfotransferase family protein
VSLIEISNVAHPDEGATELWGGHIDVPGPGHQTDTYALDVIGWALGRQRGVSSVELVQGGVCLRRVAANVARDDLAERFPDVPAAHSAGFFASVGSLSLEREFELLVRVRLEEKGRAQLGTIRGRRARLSTAYEPRLRPLMITTLGRTGSTALVRLLQAHPEIAAYRPFEYEPRVATYWVGVLKGLAEPSSYRRQITPAGTIDGNWWVGDNPPVPRRIRDPEVNDWLGTGAVETLAEFCQSRIDGLYERVAAISDRPGATFFAEKFRPDSVSSLMWELYPRAREIILARDFRDMVSSIIAFNAKRGFQGFRRGSFETDADFVMDNVKNSAAALAAAWRNRSAVAHLVRYEDLLRQPDETLEALLGYLELDAAPATVEAMRETLTDRAPLSEGHRTTPDPAASIGRWRNDLDSELQKACEQALGPALEAFGYEPAGSVAA